MVAMVTEAWTLAGCGVATSKSSSSAVAAQELLYPAPKKHTSSFRAVAVSSSKCQDRDAIVLIGRRRGITSCLLAALAAAGVGAGAARSAILEADDDLELLERVKEDKKKRLQKQGLINSSTAETGYLQDLVYKLSKVGQAIDKDDLSAAGDILGSDSDAPWVQNVNGAFSKFSSSSEEKSAVDSFNSSLASLFASVSKSDIGSSKSAFVSSATALEKWVSLAGLTGKLKGF
ncbi:thylakoid lumenal 16.5 kDa protein, chloroplastic [Lolium rigidum]|uniref:thylakoid lumenal 16.5 kDa protein, chloroplastic n=1 Tax=Lolium rigidum TaxID=89674 RepID=UPI001F5C32BC|nr:thylakoid lumenal 16.5 kDa protein, chloroplastic [Lolium rigidum]